MRIQQKPGQNLDVLIVAPVGRDAPLAIEVLKEAGIYSTSLPDLSGLCQRLGQPAGAILLAEEALTKSNITELKKVLNYQEAWSSLPIILMTSQSEKIFSIDEMMQILNRGVVTILERPFKVLTLIASVKVALSSRMRQYQVKELIHQQEVAVQQRDDFLSIASHELKTPITSLKIQVQMRKRLLSKGDQSVFSPEKVTALINNTDTQLDRLSRLIDDMLDISRIVNGKLSLTLTSFEMDSLIYEVYSNFHAEFEIAGCEVKLDIEKNVQVHCDRYRIEQALANIFSNAIKYGKGKPVSVGLWARDGKAIISVSDQGIGIAEENLERIFERFERAVEGSAISGLGLGLFITRQIIEMNKGRIYVESTLGQGATFTIELPLEAQS